MRIVGLLLVLLGGLALGYEGFEPILRESTGPARAWRFSWYVPPVVGGIALVSGLLVLATSGRRGEN